MDLLRKLLEEKAGGRLDRLSTLALIVSLGHFCIMWTAFVLSRGKPAGDIYPVPMALIFLYFGALLVYVPVKETMRWKQRSKRYAGNRIGEIFIPLWVVSLLTMGVMQYFTRGHFTIPDGMWETAVGALSIGGISSISKGLHDCKHGVCPEEEEASENEKTA